MVGDTFAFTPLATTGAPNGAAAPAPDATIRMVDYGFRGVATLPRNGVIRVANEGDAYHFAARLPGAHRARAPSRSGRALRSGSERAVGRVVAGEPVKVQDLISPDDDQRQRDHLLQRRGATRSCASSASTTGSGMYRIVRVR